MREAIHPASKMGQKGQPSISSPSSIQLITAQTGSTGKMNKRKVYGTENPQDDMQKDLVEFSEHEWFQTGVEFVLSYVSKPSVNNPDCAHKLGDWSGHARRTSQVHIPWVVPCQCKAHCYNLRPQPSTATLDGRLRWMSF